MNYHYDNRRRPNDFGGGPITKKPRIHPRMPNVMEDENRLISFKEFVANQPDSVEEDQACKSYNEYKLNFKRKQLARFFEQHKDEEWFRNKYRPPEKTKLEEDFKAVTARRKEIYNQMKEKNLTDGIKIAYEDKDKLSKFLKNFTLMLEGATIDEIIEEKNLSQYATSSLYISNLHPSVEKSMIEQFAKTHEGFLRVAVSDPDKQFRIRAWVTYKHMDNDALQRLCWEFNRQKFNGHETKAHPNKELESRIFYSSHWFRHKKCAAADIKQLAKLLTRYESEDCELLDLIKNHLIEETSAEEKILLGQEEEPQDFAFEEDEKLMKPLDEILLYLRVVHSVDYYAAAYHKGEDDTPLRVGTFFVRPIFPATKSENPLKDLAHIIDAQMARTKTLVEEPIIDQDEQNSLGYKDPERQIDLFMDQNIREIKPGKFESKLSLKKFVSVEYVKKHLLLKCSDKLDEVRYDVESFNNYIADPNRPL